MDGGGGGRIGGVGDKVELLGPTFFRFISVEKWQAFWGIHCIKIKLRRMKIFEKLNLLPQGGYVLCINLHRDARLRTFSVYPKK